MSKSAGREEKINKESGKDPLPLFISLFLHNSAKPLHALKGGCVNPQSPALWWPLEQAVEPSLDNQLDLTPSL